MIYEATIQFTATNEKGKEYTKKEQYLLDATDYFAVAETKLYNVFASLKDLDVTVLKRSRINEVANEPNRDTNNPDFKIFLAVVTDTFLNDDGTEKEMKYQIALFAKDIQEAHNFVAEYLKQGYDMTLKSLKETKFIDYLE